MLLRHPAFDELHQCVIEMVEPTCVANISTTARQDYFENASFCSDIDRQIAELNKQKGLLQPRLDFTSELQGISEVRVLFTVSPVSYLDISKFAVLEAEWPPSASRYYRKGHFCDQFFAKFTDTECAYDREPERSRIATWCWINVSSFLQSLHFSLGVYFCLPFFGCYK